MTWESYTTVNKSTTSDRVIVPYSQRAKIDSKVKRVIPAAIMQKDIVCYDLGLKSLSRQSVLGPRALS